MSRFARNRRVFFVEEPIYDSTTDPVLETVVCPISGVCVVTPHLASDANRNQEMEALLKEFFNANKIEQPVLWYYTPMALEFFPQDVPAAAVIYDCMDELSMFRGAPSQLQMLEKFLLQKAQLVFTGGVSLFESKRRHHAHVFPFPSGVDLQHFAQARTLPPDFNEHASMARPRLGFAGVIDERINLALVDEIAAKRPEWQIVMIGPVVKISPDTLPQRPNIHWLGMKSYNDLPKYFAGWDAGIMPFALNDATRFISPTKTPEYLSAGLPVISTSIRDVVRPYGELGLAKIADNADQFIAAAEQVMNVHLCLKWRERVDEFLKGISWDSVWERMDQLLLESVRETAAQPVVTGTTVAAQSTEREDKEALPSFDIFTALASVTRV